ncbi:enoyl-CoA hydratase/isomerase domain-containing protein [Cavenderia fasciculata]|uniref:3-hydroxyisobutyryl-CoA hydrolase n=1 Tax=Cavenderia fasciculata TaxID=261658 RepID=F4PNE6_CACFS|nr:enoyl-CoA hydratase/isomerase domain-containing protein [Cavenderia fasciculata]EGG22999.1 enoyl-CoA hydratase/isomerase domain-containing protein [Cavenderia fasciculata]|eukprot:XP_004360850.1 enoyl-CoA hydratase/isomerase domain-containing protein [Cavenderia fasciculata]
MDAKTLGRIESVGGHLLATPPHSSDNTSNNSNKTTTTTTITNTNNNIKQIRVEGGKKVWETMDNTDMILERQENHCTVISLNRPKQLNVLCTDIFVGLNRKLLNYVHNDNLHLLILKGSGNKAYCAGGDIKELTSNTRKLSYSFPKYFFTHEYNMDYTAATLRKPSIVFWDGIAMGGGLGVSCHSTFRIVTERTVWAMPEVSIGLFPDVGGSYFLSRLPDSLGNYLGLTGKSITGADCLQFGIATHYILSERLPDLERKLVGLVNSQDRNQIESIIMEFASTPKTPSPLLQEWQLIQKHFANKFKSVEEILKSLESSGTKWGTDMVALIRKKSPTSVKIAFRQVKVGSSMTLEQVFTMEYRIAIRCLESPDFFEGVRAVVVDKDHKPKWNPSTLEQVTDDQIDRYFSPLPLGQELQLGSNFYVTGLHQ